MKVKIGKGLIILAFFISLLGVYVVFALPIFIAGAIFILISKKKPLTKGLWVLLPLVVWYPAMMGFLLLSQSIGFAIAKKYDFIFNDDFRGKVRIIHNSKCGNIPLVRNGRNVIEIPNSGIYLLKPEINYGIANYRYFSRKPDGHLIEMHSLDWSDFDSSFNERNHVVLPRDLVGVFSGDMAEGNTDRFGKGYSYHYLDFIIASESTRTKYYDHHYLVKFDSLVKQSVTKCYQHTKY